MFPVKTGIWRGHLLMEGYRKITTGDLILQSLEGSQFLLTSIVFCVVFHLKIFVHRSRPRARVPGRCYLVTYLQQETSAVAFGLGISLRQCHACPEQPKQLLHLVPELGSALTPNLSEAVGQVWDAEGSSVSHDLVGDMCTRICSTHWPDEEGAS